ncbi:MAG TPA: hypothetical protein VEJ23_06925 [Solirubrobacteraceae bacterium]|nr:hypothetical protein [Solirubrobacteraceae bacterium]
MTRTIDELSGPPGLPLLANAHQLRTSGAHQTIERCLRERAEAELAGAE